MTISGPLFVVSVLAVTALVLQLLRRWTIVVASISAATAGGLTGLLAFVPLSEAITLGPLTVSLGEPLVLLGRALVIEPVDRLPMMFIGATAALLFIVAWRILPHSNFYPAGLAVLALLASSLMVEQVVYAALLVEMAGLLTIFPLHEPIVTASGSHYGGRAKGGLQYMVYTTLALPGLMITQLLLEQFEIFPGDLGLLRTATLLLSLSFAILLGAVPFQSWLSTVAMDGSPPVVTFLFTVNLGTVWFLLLAYLESYSWLIEQTAFSSLLTGVGLLMMVIGGALAASQRRLGRIVGYATLVDNGAMLVALSTRKVAGLALAIMMLMARPLALGLMTVGLDGLRRLGRGEDQVDLLTGAAWQAPWRTLAYMLGGVAMAGFPLSLGFVARWGLYRLLLQANLFQALLALGGSAGVMMGLLSATRVLLASTPERRQSPAITEDRGVLLMILILVGAILLLGLFPQLVSRIAFQTAQGFTFFSQ